MCEVSVFHPFVYPQYRPPMSDSELAAIEAEERALEEEEYGVAPYDEDELTINDIRNKSQSAVRSNVHSRKGGAVEDEDATDYQEAAR